MLKTIYMAMTLVATLIIGACASVPTTPPTSQLKASNDAYVKGVDPGFWSMFKLGTSFNVGIEGVDGKNMRSSWNGDPKGLQLPAGSHRLTVECSATADADTINGPVTRMDIDVTLIAGHVYQLEPDGGINGCGTKIVDVTDQAGTKN